MSWKNSIFCENIFLIGVGSKKLLPLGLPILKYWFLIGQRFSSKKNYTLKIVNPSAFQNGMTLENRMKIEGARGKNVRSSIFFNFLVKTLGGYFGAQKVDFDDSKSKNGYSPMDSSSFRGKNQNLSPSFHAYQIHPQQ